MDFLSLLFIAFSLSADCFAVTLGGCMSGRTFSRLQITRTALAFGFFQFLMPLLGWLAGRTIVEIIAAYDHWLAFILLAFVSGKMVWDSLHTKDGECSDADITRGMTLLTLSVATSIDALSIGLSFAFLEINIWQASLLIGIIAILVTAAGFLLGKKVGSLFGRRAKLVGGLILIGIGLRVLLTHLL